MNARTAIAALAVVAALTLTGCSATSAGGSSDVQRAGGSADETAAPLVAEETSEPDTGTGDAYLVQLREALEGSGGNNIPDATDEQLIAAGHDACDQMRSGIELQDVQVIEGEEMGPTGYKDSTRIAAAAAIHFCTDMNPGG